MHHAKTVKKDILTAIAPAKPMPNLSKKWNMLQSKKKNTKEDSDLNIRKNTDSTNNRCCFSLNTFIEIYIKP